MKALSTNRLASSSHYEAILHEYNQEFERTAGKVNSLKFYREVILPLIPNYHLQSWYQFLHRYRGRAGLIVAQVTNGGPRSISGMEVNRLENNLLANEAATNIVINRILNIGARAVHDVLEHPELLSAKERVEIGLKAMKAQDSRIHALGKVREDNRQQEKFERAFNDAAYGS